MKKRAGRRGGWGGEGDPYKCLEGISVLSPSPPSISLPLSVLCHNQAGSNRGRTQTQRKSEFNTDRRENPWVLNHTYVECFLPLKPASVFLMQQYTYTVYICVCFSVFVLRLLVSMGCKYEYANVITNQCEYVLSVHLQPPYEVKWKSMAPLSFLFILLLLSRLKQQPSRTHNSSNPRKIK